MHILNYSGKQTPYVNIRFDGKLQLRRRDSQKKKNSEEKMQNKN